MKPFRGGQPPRPAATPPPTGSVFSLPNRQAYETAIFRAAKYFTVTRRVRELTERFPNWQTTEFANFVDAINTAYRIPGSLVYAVATIDGIQQSVPIGPDRWKEFYLCWKRRGKS
jgi:hypothetical protein